MSNAKVTRAEHAAAKAAYEKAAKAFKNADARLSSAAEAWLTARVEYNASLPDGFYAEADTGVLDGDFPFYLKVGENWYWHNGTNFMRPDWLEDGDFDLEVVPIAEVDLTGLS